MRKQSFLIGSITLLIFTLALAGCSLLEKTEEASAPVTAIPLAAEKAPQTEAE